MQRGIWKDQIANSNIIFSYKIMRDCWEYAPKLRPTFSNLVQRWNDLMTPEGLELLSQETRADPEMPMDEETVESLTNEHNNENSVTNLKYVDSSVPSTIPVLSK
jgi:hypothetical protein